MRTLVALVVGALALPEIAHGVASRFGYGVGRRRRGSAAIIVLGCPTNPDGSLHPLQRWRVDIAKRSLSPDVQAVVFTGRTAATGRTEAASMAEYGRAIGIPDGLVVLEERARTTWENLEYSAPLIDKHERLMLVSDPLHAFRARIFFRRQNPALAEKLAPADDYRLGERPRWKVGTFLYELGAWRRSFRHVLEERQR